MPSEPETSAPPESHAEDWDPLRESPDLQRRQRRFLGVYLALCTLMLLNFAGLIVNTPTLVAGIPASVLWLLITIALFLSLTIVGYLYLFRHWASDKDADAEP
jgi:uncharacterized membrane protein